MDAQLSASYHQEFDVPEQAPLSLEPCGQCGRTFTAQALVKHQKACAKVQKKRKVFDSGKMRAMGTEIPVHATMRPGGHSAQSSQAGSTTVTKKKSNWREQHQSFISSIRAAREATEAEKRGERPPTPPRAAIPSDYKQCPFCSRNFNPAAAERHIPFCKEQKSRLGVTQPQTKPDTSTAKARMDARTKYQAPSAVAGRGSGYTPGKQNGAGGASRYNTGNASAGATRSVYSLRTGSSTSGQRSLKDTVTLSAKPVGDRRSERSSSSGSASSGGRPARLAAVPLSEKSALSSGNISNMRYTNGAALPSLSSFEGKPLSGPPKYCHECGTRYPITTAKFCCECGMKRLTITR